MRKILPKGLFTVLSASVLFFTTYIYTPQDGVKPPPIYDVVEVYE